MHRSIWVSAGVTLVAVLALLLTSRTPAPVPAPGPLASSTPVESDRPALAATPRPDSYYTPPALVPDAADGVAETHASAEESTDAAAGVTASPRARTPAKATVPGTPVSAVSRTPRASGTPEEYLADAVFGRLDSNGDGILTGDEIPTALQSKLGSRKSLNREAFVALFRASVQQLRAEQSAVAAGSAPNLPTAPPKWFHTLDTDRDGQVSLSEWRAVGRSAAEFQRIDTNNDGIITRQEVLTFAAREQASAKAASPATTARDGSKLGEAPNAAAAHPDESKTNASSAPPARVRSNALFAHYVLLAAGAAPKSNAQAAAAPPVPAPAASAPAPAAPAEPDREIATVAMPLDDNPYWVARNKQNLAALDAGDLSDVLFLGDSITDYLWSRSGAPLWEAYYEPLGALNFAMGGARTSQVLWQVETGQVARAAPKLVVLLVGSNNLGLVGQEPEEVAEGIAKIVDEISEQLPKTRILLLGILPRVDTSAPDPAKIEKVNDMIANLHDGQRVFYLDIGSQFVEPDGSISPEVMPDGAHPSLWGYELYSEAVWPAVTGLLK